MAWPRTARWEGWETHPKMVFMIGRNRAELGLSPRGRAGVSQECRLGGRPYGWFWRGGRGGTGCLGRHSGEKDRCYESKERFKARGWRLGGKTQRQIMLEDSQRRLPRPAIATGDEEALLAATSRRQELRAGLASGGDARRGPKDAWFRRVSRFPHSQAVAAGA